MSLAQFSDLLEGVIARWAAALESHGFPLQDAVVRNGSFVAIVPIALAMPDQVQVSACRRAQIDPGAWLIVHEVQAAGFRLLAGICKGENVESDDAVTQTYTRCFARALIDEYRSYLTRIAIYSKKRDIGDKKLYNDTHFRQTVGEASKSLTLADAALSRLDAPMRLVFDYVKQASEQCTPLLGGRSLLSGASFDLRITSLLVENTYVI